MEEFEKLSQEYEIVGHSYEVVEGMKGETPYKQNHLKLEMQKDGEIRIHYIDVTGKETEWKKLLK